MILIHRETFVSFGLVDRARHKRKNDSVNMPKSIKIDYFYLKTIPAIFRIVALVSQTGNFQLFCVWCCWFSIKCGAAALRNRPPSCIHNGESMSI